jgi:hypothetical protein
MVGAGVNGLGMPMHFTAGEYRLLDRKVGEWLCEHSKKRETPADLEDPDPTVRLNAIQYAFAMEGDPFFGTPLDVTGQVEYLQLGASDMYLQRGTDGVKTHRKIIPVKGMEQPITQTPATSTPESVRSGIPESVVEKLLARIEELETRYERQQPAIRGRRRPRTRLAPKAPTSEPTPSAEAPA